MPGIPAAAGASTVITVLIWLAFAVCLCLLWRSGQERRTLSVERCEIAAGKLGPSWDGFTMVILADLHGNELGEENRTLLEAIDREKPDAVFIAGDMLTEHNGRMPDMEPLWALLEGLVKKYPVYYGDGNHEQRMKSPESFHEWLTGLGVVHLRNESVTVRRAPGEGELRISGLCLAERFYLKKGKPLPMEPDYMEKTLGAVPEEDFQVLLAHNPLYAQAYAEWGADLTASGHFHGGTIRVPGLGGVMTPQFQFFFPYTRGFYRLKGKNGREDSILAVSGGLGTHSINIRLNNPCHLLTVRLNTKGIEQEKQDGTGSKAESI